MANRSKGEGCYWYNDKTCRWVFRIQLKDLNGNPKVYTLSNKTRAELKERVAKFLQDYERTRQPMREYIKLGEFTQYWLDSIKPTIKDSTWEYYQRLSKLYIIPEFENTKIKDITPLQIQNFLNGLNNCRNRNNPEKFISASTINGIRRTFIALLTYALDNQIIPFNPASKTKPQRAEPKEIVALDEKQLKNFLKIAATKDYIYIDVAKSRTTGNIEYYPKQYQFPEDKGQEYNRHCFLMQITLMAFTGMRIGETFALKWPNVNFETGEITIKYNLSNTGQLTAPKTNKSIRKILLDAGTLKQLWQWKEEQEKFAQKYHGNFVKQMENLVFTNMFGGFISRRNQKESYWDKLLVAARLPANFTPHCLRHTHATLLLKSGVDVRTVSERLGHASAVMTLNVYSHVLDSMQQNAVNAIANWRN